MHIPDGYINVPVSLGAGVVAAGGAAVCVRKAREDLDERLVPMAGLTAAFIFAVQMLNFPILGGTSGHLLGGALAAILVGPYAGALAVAVVLVVQAFLFADGGLTALGLNVLNIGIVPAFAGYAIFALLVRALPKTKSATATAGGVAAGLSVPIGAVVFVLEYWLGGTVSVPIAQVTAAMLGFHVLIGIGEGLITAAVLSSVLSVRPDLAYGGRHLIRAPQPRSAGAVPQQPTAGG